MKIIYTSTLLVCLVLNSLFSQESNCVREANFGNSIICLPQFFGYEECYNDSIVKKLADGTEIPSNIVLGFYLNENTYQRKDSLGLFSFDDYFKVYGTKQIQNYKANPEFLKQMKDILSENFVIKNWELMKKEIDKIDYEIEIGAPTVIDSYNINGESFSFIMLAKYDFEGIEPYTLAMTINGFLKNERLIWMAYYLNYQGEETINDLKKKSNYILTEIMNSGK